jgi:formate C-acetyltransferase
MAEPAYRTDPERESSRFKRIKNEILSIPMYLCTERAHLITDFFRSHDDPAEPMTVRKAKALRHVLRHKSAEIHPDELIVGNVGAGRRSVIMQPEAGGVFLSEDLLWIGRRRTAPLEISWSERLRLIGRVLSYWLPRNMIVRTFFPRIDKFAKFTLDQLHAAYYFINESNGIGHLIPNYEKMLRLGVTGYLEELDGRNGDIHRAMRITCEGLVDFANRLAQRAERLAAEEPDEMRSGELLEVARICRKVPLRPAETFHEALQSLWLTHLTVNLEGLNSAVSFGRIDRFLYPYYRKDLEEGRIDPDRARELLLCFCAKADEHFYLLSARISEYHGGLLVVQGATVGGVGKDGKDAVNDLTYLFLDVMEESGLREPNFQARLHRGSPQPYLRRVVEVAAQGKGVPSMFNDEVCIPALTDHGYPIEESRDYGVVGCVELGLPGESFFSTDAAMLNLPICLELALNRGRRFKGGRRVGARTPDPATFRSIDDVIEAFREQVGFITERMVEDLRVVEKGNRDFHPTPFTSMLIEGCIETARDVTAGGARYNHSGVQGIGVADTADSLAALETVVFREGKFTLVEVITALRRNFESDPRLQAELMRAPKFGNDHELPDRYADLVVSIYHTAVTRHENTRGGPYVPGFYSDTSYGAFGQKTGALPSGRRAGEPFAVSLSPSNGRERRGPTAILNSVARVDGTKSPNGYALNLRFDPLTVAGEKGTAILGSLLKGYFDQGGMELQLNVVSQEVLEEARRKPGTHPGLVVRVAGYCAYFDDLPDSTKDEIIARTQLTMGR